MPVRASDPPALVAFTAGLAYRDPKTVTAYLSTLRDLVAWLAVRPGGTPFHPHLLTATAVQGYLDSLAVAGRTPRTRSRALTAIHRFSAWAVETGALPRDPTPRLERPTVVALAPQELTADQRFVLKTLVERADSAHEKDTNRNVRQLLHTAKYA